METKNRQKVLLTDLSLKLKHPTAAKLREACIEVCDSRFKLKDEKVLADLFKTQANRDAYLQATMTERDAILGRALFEAFPDNPEDAHATGNQKPAASSEAVFRTKSTVAS